MRPDIARDLDGIPYTWVLVASSNEEAGKRAAGTRVAMAS
jgi:hypothetical protein